MSLECAQGLSPYDNKGTLGLPEKYDSDAAVAAKVAKLAKLMNESKYVVVHTGAGISTSAGIPDFRGPNGVWTLEQEGRTPNPGISFNDARPTITHMALMKLVEADKVKFIVSQNVDGLHLRSGIPRKKISELHGNIFVMKCRLCKRQIIGTRSTSTVGQKCLNMPCTLLNLSGRPCRGKLFDTIVDWENSLPQRELTLATHHSNLADLSITLGTSLQIMPSSSLPLITIKNEIGQFVICNLQSTRWDSWACLVIRTNVDNLMVKLMKSLNLEIPQYNEQLDPTRTTTLFRDWTLLESEVALTKQLIDAKRSREKQQRQKQKKKVTKKTRKSSKKKKKNSKSATTIKKRSKRKTAVATVKKEAKKRQQKKTPVRAVEVKRSNRIKKPPAKYATETSNMSGLDRNKKTDKVDKFNDANNETATISKIEIAEDGNIVQQRRRRVAVLKESKQSKVKTILGKIGADRNEQNDVIGIKKKKNNTLIKVEKNEPEEIKMSEDVVIKKGKKKDILMKNEPEEIKMSEDVVIKKGKRKDILIKNEPEEIKMSEDVVIKKRKKNDILIKNEPEEIKMSEDVVIKKRKKKDILIKSEPEEIKMSEDVVIKKGKKKDILMKNEPEEIKMSEDVVIKKRRKKDILIKNEPEEIKMSEVVVIKKRGKNDILIKVEKNEPEVIKMSENVLIKKKEKKDILLKVEKNEPEEIKMPDDVVIKNAIKSDHDYGIPEKDYNRPTYSGYVGINDDEDAKMEF